MANSIVNSMTHITNAAQKSKDNEVAETILAFLSLASALLGEIGDIFDKALGEVLGIVLQITEGIMGITGLISDIKGKPDNWVMAAIVFAACYVAKETRELVWEVPRDEVWVIIKLQNGSSLDVWVRA